MRQGLYQVIYKNICAGFYIDNNGKVIYCAPVLRKKFNFWKTIAVYIGD